MGIRAFNKNAPNFINKFRRAVSGDSTGLDAVTPAPVPPIIEVLLALGNDTTTNVSGAVSIPPSANTLWVFGAGGGGAGSRAWYGDPGGSGGSGAAVIWTAYPVDAVPLRGTSVPYQVGGGGGMSSAPGDGENGENGGATQLGPSGSLVNIGGGIGGGPGTASKSGGTLPAPIAPYGGSGGDSGTGYPRGGPAPNPGASAATGGGGGGSGFNSGGTSGSAGGSGGSGDPGSSTRGLPGSFTPGYVVVQYSTGGPVAPGSWSAPPPNQYPSGVDKLYAHGGGSAYSPAGGEHRGGGAGGGVRFTVDGSYVTNPGTQGPTDGYYGGGGGGGRSFSDQTYPPASGLFSGAGGGGCLIVLAEYV